MAVGYNSSSIIGGPLDKDVLTQLEKREGLYTKRSGRTNEQLLYLNAKTGWVKLSSSVNVDGSSTLAKNNVLFGGTYREKSTTPKSGIHGISGGVKKENSAYQRYESVGFRPMPGIDNFKIDAKNRFGTLREASIDFKVWSVEQLTEFESLYLRPGFTVLLEWGHSMYIDNKGRVQKTAPNTIDNYFTGNLTKEKISEKIKQLKIESNQNYDAVFGYIKNFLWSYRTDGGYDCKLTIISAGELIESVSVALSSTATGEDNDDASVGESPTLLKTPIHKFLETITNARSGTESINKILKEKVPVLYEKYLKETNRTFFPILKVGITGTYANRTGEVQEGEGDRLRYITLGDLLALINVTFLLEDQNKEKLFKFNLDEEKSLFLTFPEHITLDPKIAFLSKRNNFKNTNLKYFFSDLLTTIKKDESILNIGLEINYVLDTLDHVVNQSSSQSTVLNFIQGILNGLTSTLGDINEFGLHYVEEEFMYYIVDRRLTPNESDVAKSIINLTGLKATVSNVSLSSKLSSNIASMIAISAQASGTDVGQDVENMFRWNEGLEDRIVSERNTNAAKSLEQRKKLMLSNVITLSRAVKEFNSTKSYNGTTIDSLSTVHRALMQFLSREAGNKSAKAGAAGIIPFDLEITLDGIGGIKIGQAFTVNEGILPEKYNGVVAFLVTGISHVIQNNKWNTELKAQTIIIGRRKDGPITEEDSLISAEDLDEAFTLQRPEPDPTREFEIINLATDNGVQVDPDTYGKVVSVEYVLKNFLNQNPVIQTTWAAFFLNLKKDYKGYKIKLTGVYRSMEAAIKLFNEGKGTAPGRSPHIYAGALDFNIVLPDGTTLLKKDPPGLHEITGIPDVARGLGMYWAGNQTLGDGVFDTVHYQVRYYNYRETYNEIIETSINKELSTGRSKTAAQEAEARGKAELIRKDQKKLNQYVLDAVGDPPINFGVAGIKKGDRLVPREES